MLDAIRRLYAWLCLIVEWMLWGDCDPPERQAMRNREDTKSSAEKSRIGGIWQPKRAIPSLAIQRCLKSWRFNSRERREHFDHCNRLRVQEGSGSFPAIPDAGHCTYSHLRLLGLVSPARRTCQNDAMQLAQADASRCVGLIDIDSREEYQGTTRIGKHKPSKGSLGVTGPEVEGHFNACVLIA